MQDRFKFRWYSKIYNEMCDVNCIELNNEFVNFQQGKFNDISTRINLENGVLMQCTGLKDKNGKLIYEGDIVKFAFHELAEEKAWEKAVIVWGDKYKYPAFDLDKCEFECNGLSYIFNEDWAIEVIGNIYENPELLED